MGQLVGLVVAIASVSYLLGSFPTGFLLTQWLKGIDIREQGSGSTGATNVLRTVGKGPAALVLLIDALKGSLSVGLVLLLPRLMVMNPAWQPWLVMLAALSAIVGHSKPIWLGFRGGKSVATSIGVILTMTPLVGLSTLALFGVVLAIWRRVSLGSIIGAAAVMILMVVFRHPLPYCLLGGVAGGYVILRHRANIGRLLAGTEPSIGQKLGTGSESTSSV
ncbi:MAG: glycerol-3-phosphate 1-O-acyltransferase PlsY [Cyanobacteria bacterium P01_G01_bin.54]